MGKIEMDITLVPNFFTCCILQNLINLGKKELDIQKLFQVLNWRQHKTFKGMFLHLTHRCMWG
jgi:hypothetical protein